MSTVRNSFTSRGPVIKEKVQVAQRMINANNEVFFNYFDTEVMWLFESESRYSYWYNDKELKEGSQFNDFYGFMSCVESAAVEAQEQVEHYNINTNSLLVIKVYTTITKRPVALDETADGKMWNTPSSVSKCYVNRFDEDDFCFYCDDGKINEYQNRANKKDWDAYELIQDLRIKKQTLVKDFYVGSSQEGFTKNLESLKSTINFMMAKLRGK